MLGNGGRSRDDLGVSIRNANENCNFISHGEAPEI
ncbi:hypothetical protein ACP4OV_026772 [Aristida adscensionis]